MDIEQISLFIGRVLQSELDRLAGIRTIVRDSCRYIQQLGFRAVYTDSRHRYLAFEVDMATAAGIPISTLSSSQFLNALAARLGVRVGYWLIDTLGVVYVFELVPEAASEIAQASGF